MAKCKKCSKKGLFLELYYIDGSKDGLCIDCFTAEQARLHAEAEAKKEAEKRQFESTHIKTIVFPTRQDGHPLQYTYYLPLRIAPGVDIFSDILCGSERIADVKSDGDKIQVVCAGKLAGWIDDSHKSKMLSDWEKGGFPAHAVIRADGEHVNLQFFKDKTIGCDKREQTVVKLKSYRGEYKQLTVSCMSEKDQLDVEDEYNDDNNFVLSWAGQEIGVLPSAAAKRYAEEGAYVIVVDHVDEQETDTGDFVYIPYVRIYW